MEDFWRSHGGFGVPLMEDLGRSHGGFAGASWRILGLCMEGSWGIRAPPKKQILHESCGGFWGSHGGFLGYPFVAVLIYVLLNRNINDFNIFNCFPI